MMRFMRTLAAVLLVVTIGFAPAVASSIDTDIKNLKSDDPEVRAKAAYDLGCG